MILQILLLLVGSYLSFILTIFYFYLKNMEKAGEKEKQEIYKANDRREKKLDKILHLSYKIDTKTYLNKK